MNEIHKFPNPCEKLKKLEEEETKVQGVTDEEADSVQSQISEHFKAPLKIICKFALRRTEALNLTAADVKNVSRDGLSYAAQGAAADRRGMPALQQWCMNSTASLRAFPSNPSANAGAFAH